MHAHFCTELLYGHILEAARLLVYFQLKGLQLISIGELEQLTELMSATEYAPLRPLLLLLGWDRYPHNGSGQELLETLWTPEVSSILRTIVQGLVGEVQCLLCLCDQHFEKKEDISKPVASPLLS